MSIKEIGAIMVSTKVKPKVLYEDVGMLIDWLLTVGQQGLVALEQRVDMSNEDKSFIT